MKLRLKVAAVSVALLATLSPAVAEATMYSGPSGWRDVRGAIEQEWIRLGGSRSAVGLPVTSEIPTPHRPGAFNHFERGSIYWSPTTGAREVRGSIRGLWASRGWENGQLGFPVTHETGTPNGRGRFNHFQGGSVFWTPTTGAHEVRGAIRGAWAANGWEAGQLGFPRTSERTTPDGKGRFNDFEGGSVYWTPTTGAHAVGGGIRGRWAEVGAEKSVLGYPLTSERRTPDGAGRYNLFQGGAVYWTPTTGAHEVFGAIFGAWASLGYERSPLGYPVKGEYAVDGGRRVDFQRGSLTWTPAGGVVADVTISGTGNRTLPILPRAMVAEVTSKATGGVFKVEEIEGAERFTAVEETGAWSGTVPLNFEGGQAKALQITSTGAWTIRLRPLSAVPTFDRDQTRTGTGTTSTVMRYTGPAGTAHIARTSPGFLMVAAYTADTQELVDVAILEGGGPTAASLQVSGKTFFEVYNEGSWTLDVL